MTTDTTATPLATPAELRDRIADEVRAQRDGYLPSPDLSPDWIAGWHAATDHHAHRIAKGAGPEGATPGMDALIEVLGPLLRQGFAGVNLPPDFPTDGRVGAYPTDRTYLRGQEEYCRRALRWAMVQPEVQAFFAQPADAAGTAGE